MKPLLKGYAIILDNYKEEPAVFAVKNTKQEILDLSYKIKNKFWAKWQHMEIVSIEFNSDYPFGIVVDSTQFQTKQKE